MGKPQNAAEPHSTLKPFSPAQFCTARGRVGADALPSTCHGVVFRVWGENGVGTRVPRIPKTKTDERQLKPFVPCFCLVSHTQPLHLCLHRKGVSSTRTRLNAYDASNKTIVIVTLTALRKIIHKLIDIMMAIRKEASIATAITTRTAKSERQCAK